MPRRKRSTRTPVAHDVSFEWVTRELGPEFAEWQSLAATWLQTQPLGLADRINGLRAFFKNYLHGLKLPLAPSILLRRNQPLPDFFETSVPHSHGGIKWNNKVRIFLDWVLVTHFAEPDDNDRPVVSPEFWNPVPYRSQKGAVRPNESVHSPLPYRYIVELSSRVCLSVAGRAIALGEPLYGSSGHSCATRRSGSWTAPSHRHGGGRTEPVRTRAERGLDLAPRA